jgi:hypothetical protein
MSKSTRNSGVRSRTPFTPYEELLTLVGVRNRAEAACDAHEQIALQRRLLLRVAQELQPRQDQKAAEDVDDDVEGNELCPDGDHGATHDQRADDAPEEHPVLVLRGHGERREDQQEDEDVVDAERLLDKVAGRPFEPLLRALEVVDADIEGDGEADPHGAPCERFTPFNLVGVAVKDAQVERKHAQHEGQKEGPGNKFT